MEMMGIHNKRTNSNDGQPSGTTTTAPTFIPTQTLTSTPTTTLTATATITEIESGTGTAVVVAAAVAPTTAAPTPAPAPVPATRKSKGNVKGKVIGSDTGSGTSTVPRGGVGTVAPAATTPTATAGDVGSYVLEKLKSIRRQKAMNPQRSIRPWSRTKGPFLEYEQVENNVRSGGVARMTRGAGTGVMGSRGGGGAAAAAAAAVGVEVGAGRAGVGFGLGGERVPVVSGLEGLEGVGNEDLIHTLLETDHKHLDIHYDHHDQKGGKNKEKDIQKDDQQNIHHHHQLRLQQEDDDHDEDEEDEDDLARTSSEQGPDDDFHTPNQKDTLVKSWLISSKLQGESVEMAPPMLFHTNTNHHKNDAQIDTESSFSDETCHADIKDPTHPYDPHGLHDSSPYQQLFTRTCATITTPVRELPQTPHRIHYTQQQQPTFHKTALGNHSQMAVAHESLGTPVVGGYQTLLTPLSAHKARKKRKFAQTREEKNLVVLQKTFVPRGGRLDKRIKNLLIVDKGHEAILCASTLLSNKKVTQKQKRRQQQQQRQQQRLRQRQQQLQLQLEPEEEEHELSTTSHKVARTYSSIKQLDEDIGDDSDNDEDDEEEKENQQVDDNDHDNDDDENDDNVDAIHQAEDNASSGMAGGMVHKRKTEPQPAVATRAKTTRIVPTEKLPRSAVYSSCSYSRGPDHHQHHASKNENDPGHSGNAKEPSAEADSKKLAHRGIALNTEKENVAPIRGTRCGTTGGTVGRKNPIRRPPAKPSPSPASSKNQTADRLLPASKVRQSTANTSTSTETAAEKGNGGRSGGALNGLDALLQVAANTNAQPQHE